MLALLLAAAPALISGTLVTVGVAIGAACVAAPAALLAGLAAHARSWPVRAAARCYVEFFRGTSALVQLYVLYYVMPLFGILLPALLVGIFGVGLCMGAYGAEIVRAAIGAIPAGQYDAGAALGLRPAQIFRLVVFPQALRVMVPQLANLAIELLKATALVSLITLHDLTFEAQLINQQTLRTTEVFLSILIIYYLLSRGIVSMTTMLERRLDRPGLHPA